MRRNPMKNSNRRIKYVLCMFFSFLFLLIVKLFFLQIFPTEEVISQYTNNQSEVVMDQRYQVFDVNNKDLVNYKINYIVVFDNKPFQLNNYNGNLEELLTLNYIMKEEYSDFNFTDVKYFKNLISTISQSNQFGYTYKLRISKKSSMLITVSKKLLSLYNSWINLYWDKINKFITLSYNLYYMIIYDKKGGNLISPPFFIIKLLV